MFDLIGKLDAALDERWLAVAAWFARTFPIITWLWGVPFIAWVLFMAGIAVGMVQAKHGWLGSFVLVGTVVAAAVAGRLFL